ncbi:hypothetical protein [Tardiphaga sp. 803_E3_N1_3]|uniref:hypothetical protein n=1 Tax=Tardiphaga sp. 803_E3_N1_3 TaxID=3240785 RepID=UPI003F22E3AB
MSLYRRHERFSRQIAADPASQLAYEAIRQEQREFMLGCFDWIEGRNTPAAFAAAAEHERLRKLASEAKRRAMVGADPLNLTGHTKCLAPKRTLGADPIEQIGNMTRVKTAIARLTGKNRLDQRQVLAADTYREAFETVHSTLGGSMDFDRVRGGSAGSKAPAEAMLEAAGTLKQAKGVLGARSTIIVEQIVCHGRTTEECARLVYSYRDGQPTAARDINYVGRTLREGLTELGMLWHPSPRTRTQSFRPSKDEITAGNAGVRIVGESVYVGG